MNEKKLSALEGSLITALVIIIILALVFLNVMYRFGYDRGSSFSANTSYTQGFNDAQTQLANTIPITEQTTYSEQEILQQITDVLGQASKVDISLNGDANGGQLDIHLEFAKQP